MSFVDKKELNYLILLYLQTNYPHLDISNIIQNGPLPDVNNWTKEDMGFVDLEYLRDKYSHIGGDHLVKLLEMTLLLSDEKKPFPSPARTLLGSGDFAVVDDGVQYDMDQFIAVDSHGKNVVDFFNLLKKKLKKFHSSRRLNSKSTYGSDTLNSVHLTQYSQIGTRIPSKFSPPLFSYSKFEKLHTIQGHIMPVYCITFDKSDNRIISGSDDHLIKIWSSTTGNLLHTLRGHSAEIIDIHIDPTNTYLASCSHDHTIRIWDLKSLHPVKCLTGHDGSISKILFSPNPTQKILYSTSLSGDIFVWNLESENPPTVINCGFPIHFCSFSPGGTRFLVGCEDGTRVYSVNPPHLFQVLRGNTKLINSVVWSNSDSRFATASDDGGISVWEFDEVEEKWILSFALVEHSRQTAKCVMVLWSLDDKYLISSYTNSLIIVWDTETGKKMNELENHTKEVFVLLNHPTDKRIVVSAGYEGKIIFWNIITGEPVKQFKENSKLTDGNFNSNGNTLVISDADGFFTIYGTGSPQILKKAPIAQFFKTDYNRLIQDDEGNLIDETYQVAPHLLRDKMLLCNQQLHPYAQQPTNVSYIDNFGISPNVLQNYKEQFHYKMVKELTTFSNYENQVAEEQEISTPLSRRIRRENRTNRSHWSNTVNSSFGSLDDFELSDDDFHDDFEMPTRNRIITENRNGHVDPVFASGVLTRSERKMLAEKLERDSRQKKRHKELQKKEKSVHLVLQTQPRQIRERSTRNNRSRAVKVSPKTNTAYPNWLTSKYSFSYYSGTYTPQVGDKIVLVTKAYLNYMEFFKSNFDDPDEIPPMFPDYVYCTITEINYMNVPFSHAEITTTTDLNFPRTLFSDHPELEEKFKVFKERVFSLKLFYHPSQFPDFIILNSRFERSIILDWEEKDKLQMYFVSDPNSREGTGSMFLAEIISLSPSLRSDPFESISLKWFDDQTTQKISPWEVQKIDNEDSNNCFPPDRIEMINPDLSEQIQEVLKPLLKKKEMDAFLFPVDLEQYSDYIQIVRYPISMNIIMQRLANRYYRTIEQLKYEVNLIHYNAMAFNKSTSIIVTNASLVTDEIISVIEYTVENFSRENDTIVIGESIIAVDDFEVAPVKKIESNFSFSSEESNSDDIFVDKTEKKKNKKLNIKLKSSKYQPKFRSAKKRNREDDSFSINTRSTKRTRENDTPARNLRSRAATTGVQSYKDFSDSDEEMTEVASQDSHHDNPFYSRDSDDSFQSSHSEEKQIRRSPRLATRRN